MAHIPQSSTHMFRYSHEASTSANQLGNYCVKHRAAMQLVQERYYLGLLLLVSNGLDKNLKQLENFTASLSTSTNLPKADKLIKLEALLSGGHINI